MENLDISEPWVLQEVIDLLNESYILRVGSFEKFSPRTLIESLEALHFVMTPN
ncbi:MAG: hypothetical protein HYY21_04815 [Candidatus Tectomicrobia bacterium]|nr:hypothetical protein [Candidatus Tectomicrobia bacterium]